MSLMVAVLCVTIRVVQENIEARIIMAAIWAIIAMWWLVQAALSRKQGKKSADDSSAE
jgi:hypothetical protein